MNAGAHQAEYHVWLAMAPIEPEFLYRAWLLLTAALDFESLTFKYLPSAEALQVLKASIGLASLLSSSLHARPLLRLSDKAIDASFSKKANKSRFNRLRRLGQLEFRHLGSSEELSAVIDDFCAQYDLRQGGANHTTPFLDDPRKRAFHVALFSASKPHECDVSITTLGQRMIAGLWGMRSRDVVHLGMLAYSPIVAEHSPGKLHIMQLSKSLLAAGVRTLDLTPGGDPWKERFANEHDEVAIATLHRRSSMRRASDVRLAAQRQAKRLIAVVGLTPDRVRAVLRMVGRATPARLAAHLGRWSVEDREFRIYRADRALAERQRHDPRVCCNDPASLVRFEPGERWQSRDSFLSAALRRLESGEYSYSVVVEGRLAHVGWMVLEQSESNMSEVEQVVQFPPGNAVLYDFWSHPDFRGQGLYRATLGHMLVEAFSRKSTHSAYISVLANNGPSRHVIEAMGFEYLGSLHLRRRFGSVSKWADESIRSIRRGDG